MSLFLTQCGSNKNTISEHHIASDVQPCLICIHDQDENVALINLHGDTIAPFGKFSFCFFDTTFTFGNVYDADRKGFFAIDVNGQELFQVMAFDNGPDEPSDGMFRIIKDGKIGYANSKGEIVIQPQYECAWPFENGKAQVANECNISIEFEMTKWESESWFYLNKKGEKIQP